MSSQSVRSGILRDCRPFREEGEVKLSGSISAARVNFEMCVLIVKPILHKERMSVVV